jgi:hypothetical protein
MQSQRRASGSTEVVRDAQATVRDTAVGLGYPDHANREESLAA